MHHRHSCLPLFGQLHRATLPVSCIVRALLLSWRISRPQNARCANVPVDDRKIDPRSSFHAHSERQRTLESIILNARTSIKTANLISQHKSTSCHPLPLTGLLAPQGYCVRAQLDHNHVHRPNALEHRRARGHSISSRRSNQSIVVDRVCTDASLRGQPSRTPPLRAPSRPAFAASLLRAFAASLRGEPSRRAFAASLRQAFAITLRQALKASLRSRLRKPSENADRLRR